MDDPTTDEKAMRFPMAEAARNAARVLKLNDVLMENARLQEEVTFYRAKYALEDAPPEVSYMQRFSLTRTEAAIFLTLMGARPRVVSLYDLDDALPMKDHAENRQINNVRVFVNRLRKKLGKLLPVDPIQTVWGAGFRIDPAFRLDT